jgi:hypothetical protein
MIGLSEIFAALLGAIAAGGFQMISERRNRAQRREAVLTAICSEVDAICRLIRHQEYLPGLIEVGDKIRAGTWQGESYVIDIRMNYFSVFEGLSIDLGLLEPRQLCKIVNFYAYCKSVIDSTRPDGPFADAAVTNEHAGNMLAVENLLKAILNLGDEIVQFPAVGLFHPDDLNPPPPLADA